MNDIQKKLPLPEVFLARMKEMLGEEYDAFLASYDAPRTYGLRVNTMKISCEDFEKLVPFPVRKIPWLENGYFYEEESRPSRCPLYQAGLYYLQEPSAMTPASRLPVVPGEKVLDLCAAPGGKATALAAALDGSGLLIANDISSSRARALLRNLELFGTVNSFVTNEVPLQLTRAFPEYFDKILLDAPCSGEGMFRKEEALARDWTPEKSQELAGIQKELLLQAADMLRPGGLLLYSTCTFSPQEDEQSISWLLEKRPEMRILDMPGCEGFCAGVPSYGNGNPELKKCVRLFPHKMNGEGHFLALLSKGEPTPSLLISAPARSAVPGKQDGKRKKNTRQNPETSALEWLDSFFDEIGLKTLGGQPFDRSRVEFRKDKVYYTLPEARTFRGLTFLRNGLYLGDLKKDRFEPSQPFALALHKDDVRAVLSLPVSDERLIHYLKGETLNVLPGEAANKKGWHLLCVEGYPLGFGKLVNQTFKNKYPAGWRV